MNTLCLEEKLFKSKMKHSLDLWATQYCYCTLYQSIEYHWLKQHRYASRKVFFFSFQFLHSWMKTIRCWKCFKNLTCWCCRLFKCELNCFWFVKSTLQTAHEKHRIDFVVVWSLLLLFDVRFTYDGSDIGRNELAGAVDVEDDTSTESGWFVFVL